MSRVEGYIGFRVWDIYNQGYIGVRGYMGFRV